MPKVYLTRDEQVRARLSAWIYAQMKLNNIPQWKLAEKRGITQPALNRKLRLNSYSYEDFIFFVDFFGADTTDMLWLAGKGE